MRWIYLRNSFKFWRALNNAWSVLFFVMIIADFIFNNAYEDILGGISIVYISVLAVYVSNKEFERWYDRHEESHPGEVFVIIWSVLVGSLFILDLFSKQYQLPGAVISAYVAVLTILVITRKSKDLYRRKRRG